MTFGGTDGLSALAVARVALRTSVDQLIKVVGDQSLDQLGGIGLVEFMQDVERVRNVLS